MRTKESAGMRRWRKRIERVEGVVGTERKRWILDEQTGEMVAPEELEQRREARERAAFEQKRAQPPPEPRAPNTPT